MKSVFLLLFFGVMSASGTVAQTQGDERPLRSVSYALSVVPSASQYYKGETTKAERYAIVFSLSAATAGAYHLVYTQRADRYEEKLINYRGRPEDNAKSIARAKAQVDFMHRMRSLFLVTTGAIYAGSLIDGVLPPDGGFRHSGISITPVVSPLEAGIRLSW